MSSSLVPGFGQRYPRPDEDDDRPSRLERAPLLIESCCTSLPEALSAQMRGADRIELCIDLAVGGVTPPRALIEECVAQLSIPVHVLVREARDRHPQPTSNCHPQPASNCHSRLDRESQAFSANDFVCDEETLRRMESDIAFCRKAGVAGIVVGALTPGGTIDLPAMQRLVAAAGPLSVTFHRAFDVCSEDPFEAADKIVSLLCSRLLTSGMAPNAWDGRELIARLVRYAGERLIIMPGRGITPDLLAELQAATGAVEFHGTAIP